MFRYGTLIALLLLAAQPGCRRGDEAAPPVSRITGRAVLAADTFGSGPPVGHALEPVINGRSLPFSSVPVQGFSSLVTLTDGSILALQDNGFGALANSPDYPLGWYRLRLDLTGNKPRGGSVTLYETVHLGDPDQHLAFPLTLTGAGRPLGGADFDPESFTRLDDGSFWVGEEFGPALLHFSADGRLLAPPVAVPVVPPLLEFGRGSEILRTPDNPELRFGPQASPAEELANLPRSGGLEGLARTPDGNRLLVAVEKALFDDPDQRRRTLLEFDPREGIFTGRFWFYRADQTACFLTSLEAFTDRVFLVMERDGEEGAAARIKRIYRVDLDRADDGGFLHKTLVCDLLHLRDDLGLSAAEDRALGLGRDFSFPYVTPESLVILDARTLLVCNDNNFPFSSGRRPPDTPDDTEFIRIGLSEPLTP